MRGSSRIAPSYKSVRCYFQWKWEIFVKYLTIQRSLFVTETNFDSKAYVLKQLNKQQLIWPHPEKQTAWLTRSLRKLDEMTEEAVKVADKHWQEERFVVSPERLKTSDNILINNVNFADRAVHRQINWTCSIFKQTQPAIIENSTVWIIMAFFGRLLVGLSKLKPIPGFEAPLYSFPKDIKFYLERHRQWPY